VLSWSTSGSTAVTISGIGTVSPNGTLTVTPTATTTYNVTASNATASVTSVTTITVTVPPPTVTVTVSPQSVAAGTAATLSWSTTNAASVTIDQGIGAVAASGTRSVSPLQTTVFAVTAQNATGTSTAAATLTVTPAPPAGSGASLRFNGSNQRSRFTTLAAMTVFTVEAWVKRTADLGRYETFLSNAANGYGQETFGLYVDGANADCGGNADQFAWAYTKVGGGWFVQCSGVTSDVGVWHHVAVTRDASNITRIFVDGVLRGTQTGTAPPTSSTGALGVGAAADAATEFFSGLLDEVRISKTVRYTTTFAPPRLRFAPDADTIVLYHFDEGSGQTLGDSSNGNRNGVLGTSLAIEAIDPQWSTDTPVQ
jgi:hypothetical protein